MSLTPHLNAWCWISPHCQHTLHHKGQPVVLAANQVILSTSNYISACCSMLRCHEDGRRGDFYLKTLINSPIYLTRMEPCKIHQGNEAKTKYMPQDHHNTKPLWSSSENCWQIGILKCGGIIKWNLIKNFHWSTYTWKCLRQKSRHFIAGSQFWSYTIALVQSVTL